MSRNRNLRWLTKNLFTAIALLIVFVLPFKELFAANLCFKKIALVPGTDNYNYHLKIMLPEDLNEEVFGYLKKAYVNGKKL